MKKCIVFICTISVYVNLLSQAPCYTGSNFRVLHYTETQTANQGFDHNTRDVSAQMFRDLGAARGFEVTDASSSEVFDDLDGLMQFEVIIWSNTSGNNLLTATQEANMETYIAGGGSFVGIHAATDSYRNGSWSFYNDLVGAIVQTSPNHTSANYSGTMTQDAPGHPILDGISNPWDKVEEYYYWDEGNGGQLSNRITSLLTVARTGDMVFDSARSITWYQELPGGGRSFYTALGHARSNYTSTTNPFRTLLGNAVCWAAANALLPLDLIQFSAETWRDGNQISFKIENDGIERVTLERSSDGNTFTSLHTFPLKPGINDLQFRDRQRADQDRLFYRLRWQEVDGSDQFSKVVVIENDHLAKGITIMGNPVHGELLFRVNEVQPNESYWIFDAFGRLKHHGRLKKTNRLTTSEWGSGSYYLHRSTVTEKAVRFMVLQP